MELVDSVPVDLRVPRGAVVDISVTEPWVAVVHSGAEAHDPVAARRRTFLNVSSFDIDKSANADSFLGPIGESFEVNCPGCTDTWVF